MKLLIPLEQLDFYLYEEEQKKFRDKFIDNEQIEVILNILPEKTVIEEVFVYKNYEIENNKIKVEQKYDSNLEKISEIKTNYNFLTKNTKTSIETKNEKLSFVKSSEGIRSIEYKSDNLECTYVKNDKFGITEYLFENDHYLKETKSLPPTADTVDRVVAFVEDVLSFPSDVVEDLASSAFDDSSVSDEDIERFIDYDMKMRKIKDLNENFKDEFEKLSNRKEESENDILEKIEMSKELEKSKDSCSELNEIDSD